MSHRKMNPKMIMVAVTFSVFIMLGCQGVMNSTRALFSQDPAEVENEPTPGQNLAESEISTLSPAPTSEIKEEIRQGPSITPETGQIIPSSAEILNLTATMPPSPTPNPVTRFAVIGDYGLAGNPERDVASLIKGWHPDFIITTGDNNYPDGMPETVDENIGQYFHEFIFPYAGEYGDGADINRFFPSMGNHDWSITQGKAYWDYFTLPGNERYYDFIWGPVHLFAIDSDSREPDGVGRSSVQAKWLQDKLAVSDAVWKIVYMHHPPYSSSGDDGSIDWMQWPFKEWGATAVLAGHSHVYERLIVDDFLYFVNGLGGGPRYHFNDPVPGSQVRFRKDYGAMLIEATTDQISFQFFTRRNEIIDTFVIQNSK